MRSFISATIFFSSSTLSYCTQPPATDGSSPSRKSPGSDCCRRSPRCGLNFWWWSPTADGSYCWDFSLSCPKGTFGVIVLLSDVLEAASQKIYMFFLRTRSLLDACKASYLLRQIPKLFFICSIIIMQFKNHQVYA